MAVPSPPPLRWLRRAAGLVALVAVVVAGCVWLGLWQLERLESRRTANARVAASLHAEPAPVEQVLAAGVPAGRELEWRPVTATGRYDEAGTVLVRNRQLDGANGFEVLVPLITGTGTGTGPALLVDRGWIPAARGSARLEVPSPPPGEVVVTGRVRPGERLPDPQDLGRSEGSPTGLPLPSIRRIDPAQVGAGLSYPVYGGYAELVAERPPPAAAPTPLPEPTRGEGPHLSYAFQWFAFAVIALGGAWVLLRQDRAERAHSERPVPQVPGAAGRG